MEAYFLNSWLLSICIFNCIYPVHSEIISLNKNPKNSLKTYDRLLNFDEVLTLTRLALDMKANIASTFSLANVNGPDIINDTIVSYRVETYSSSKNDSCYLDLTYAQDKLLDFNNPWAMKMFDSYGKLDSGILEGNVKWAGDYYECLNVYAPPEVDGTARNFRGRYCSLQWDIQLSNMSLSVTSGVCIPDTCSSSLLKNDTKNLLLTAEAMPMLDNFNSLINVKSLTCNRTSRKLNSAAIIVICLMSFFCLLAVLGSSITIYENCCIKRNALSSNTVGDYKNTNQINGENRSNALNIDDKPSQSNPEPEENVAQVMFEKCKPFLKCFCLITNGSKLLNTNKTEGQLLCVHGIRFLNMAWVILGHTYAMCITTMKRPLQILDFVDNWPFQVVLQGFFAVDSFFVLSGFLLTYLFMQECNKRDGKVSWIYFYVHRYVRLTPVYMMTLAFSATVYFYLGSGPYWPDSDSDGRCKTYWWWNLLYINNFVEFTQQCLIPSWYLANDMQFYAISPLFLIALYKKPKIGYSLLGIFLCGTWLANFCITYKYELFAGMSMLATSDKSRLQEIFAKNNSYMDKLYLKPYTRIGPYLIGILLGYFMYEAKNKNRGKDSWVTLCCGWIVALTITLTCIFGLYHTDPSLIAICFYNSFSRLCFAAGLSWIIYLCLTKQAGAIDSILSYELFIPLSRLTYCAYLIHFPIILGFSAALKSPLDFSHSSTVRISIYA
ncbi:Nose resistant to fluoxetine protein 6, partial [Stegodyphus mimosarum]